MAFGNNKKGSSSGSGGGGGTDPQTAINTGNIASNDTDIASLQTDLSTLQDEALDNVYGVNEYINNLKDFRFVMTHENTSLTASCNVNGTACTYQDLLSAVDNGNGSVTFNGGGNQAFTKRAVTVETFTKLDDYMEVTVGNLSEFSTIFLAITDDLNAAPHAEPLGNYRLRLTNTYTLFDKEGNTVSSGGGAGTYRFTRTYFGFKVEKNGVLIYESPETCEYYSNVTEQVITSNLTGLFKVGEDRPATAINTSSASPGTTIVTNLDFTAHPEGELRLLFQDQATNIAWKWNSIDVKALLDSFNSGATLDYYVHIHDNDWIRIDVVDPTTGTIQLTDQGRDMEYVAAQLWDFIPQVQGTGEVQFMDLATANTFAATADDGIFIYVTDEDSMYHTSQGGIVPWLTQVDALGLVDSGLVANKILVTDGNGAFIYEDKPASLTLPNLSHFASFSDTDQTGTAITWSIAGADIKIQDDYVMAGNNITVPRDGRYEVQVSGGIENNSASSTNTVFTRIQKVDGTTNAITNEAISSFKTLDVSGARSGSSVSLNFIIDLVAGDQIRVNSAGTASTRITNKVITVKELL